MVSMSRSRWLAFAALLLSFATARATDYWHYKYHNIDVVAAGTQEYAINLAHNMHRLDTALVTVLALDLGDWRPPTYIYAIPPDEMKKLFGEDMGTAFGAGGLSNRIVMENSTNNQMHYWQAYFGYAGSLLVSEGKLRYPSWFRQGVSELFAGTVVSGNQVTVGVIDTRWVRVLFSKPLVPMRDFLHLHSGDPQVQAKDAQEFYDAQCWFLAHLIMIDKRFEKEFSSYLSLVSGGQSEDVAFATSFAMSYEDLDRHLAAVLTTGKMHALAVTVPDAPVTNLPVRLSPTAAKGYLAWLAISNGAGSREHGSELVSEVLAADPGDEHALRALAIEQAGREEYGDVLAAVDKLATNNSLSDAGYAESGHELLKVAEAIRNKKAALAADPTVLAHRAYDDYRRAIALEPEGLEYWASFADAIGQEHDATEAKDFLPKVEQLFYLHPRNSALARHIAHLCDNTGNYDDAIKFAVAWKANAITIQSRDAAVTFISSMQANRERQHLAPASGAVAQSAAP